MTSGKLTELAKAAEQIAESVSVAYRPALFARALEELIREQAFSTEKLVAPKSLSSPKRTNRATRLEKLKPMLSSHLDLKEGRQILEKGSSLERSLLVIDLADREFGLPELTPAEIAKVLSQNLGVAATPNAVGMALKKVTNRYVSRRGESQGFAYLLTPAGREYLKKWLKKSEGGASEV